MQYSVVNLSAVKENIDFRYEPEFWLPNYIEEEKRLSQLKTIPLSECSAFSNGRAFDSNEFSFDGEVYISKIGDVTQKRDSASWERVSKKHFDDLNAKYLKHNDILMTLTGDPPDVGKVQLIFNPPKDKLSWNQRVALLRLKKQDYISLPEFLFVTLSSKYCRDHIERWAKGIRQRNVGNPAVLSMAIPVLSQMQETLTKLVTKSFNLLEKSKDYYRASEQLLLSDLGLLDWKPKHELAFVKNFSDTEQAERFDAEYFQPKYEEIIEAVKKYKGGFDELGNLVKIKKSVEPGSEAYQENGVPFVRVSNLSKFELSTNNQQFISEELYEDLKSHQPKKGEILLSKDATPGMAYFLNEEPQKMIVSGGILRLKIDNKQVLPEYLTLALNSVIVQKQIERDAGGSIINHWRPDQVKATLIPVLKENKQKEIKELIEKSFSDRKLSKSLLEIAKQGVEMAIEKDEKIAENWIKDKLSDENIKL
jgi:restriction endonuclease S subunit